MIEISGTTMNVFSHSYFGGVRTLFLIRIPVEIDINDVDARNRIHNSWRQNCSLPEEFQSENQLIQEIVEIAGPISPNDFSIGWNPWEGASYVELTIRKDGRATQTIKKLERLIDNIHHRDINDHLNNTLY